jgi:hypothetical protein
MKHKIVYEGIPDIHTEDGGAAIIAELSDRSKMFIRIQSWDHKFRHERFNSLIKSGVRVRVTIETTEQKA